MKLYNSLTRSVEPFSPGGKTVSVYVCGITPYDTTHLGHAFTYTTTDILIRYLEFQGYTVSYVQNVTDIDDDILRKAKEIGEDWRTLGDRWTAHFIRDLITLNVRPPDFFPRATEVIAEIVENVQELLDREVAYEKGGSVYFEVGAWPDYGSLCCLPPEEMLAIANARGNNPDDPHKRHPLDFVLWQAQAPGEPAWDSPWGPGRPGWHIECSTMSRKFLGDTIDIHGGGGDLLFPHHESEIAQVEPLTGQKPFVRFWMHAAMVRHAGEKMSKSLGNLVMVRDLLQTFSPDALRLYLAMHHYQIEWSYDPGSLDWARRLAERWQRAVSAPAGEGPAGEGPAFDPTPWVQAFTSAMDENLNTPRALGVLDDLAVHTLLGSRAGQDVTQAQAKVRVLSQIFGMRLDASQPEARVIAGWEKHLRKFIESPTPYFSGSSVSTA